MQKKDRKPKSSAQLIWGAALTLAGLGVIFRTHQLGESLDTVAVLPGASFFIRFCLYIMAFLLVGGGLKKIFANLENTKQK